MADFLTWDYDLQYNVPTTVVGQRLPLVNGAERVTGVAHYPPDEYLNGMLIGRYLTSPYAHARIVSIDASKAEALPGVKAVITGQDPVNVLYRGRLLFAKDVVRFYTEPVAAVAAIDDDTAQEALDLIDVTYDPLPVLTDMMEAKEPGAYEIRDEVPGNIRVDSESGYGDIEQGLIDSDNIVDWDYEPMRQAKMAQGRWCAVAVWETPRKVTMWTGTKASWYEQHDYYGVLGINEGDCHVISKHGGGMWGGGATIYRTPLIAALLARKAGRPVKLWLTYPEQTAEDGDGRGWLSVHQKVGYNDDGVINAQQTDIVSDAGAYGSGADLGAYRSTFKIPNEKNTEIAVVTNFCASDVNMRGPGSPPGMHMEGITVDKVAELTGIDPLDWHRANFGMEVTPNTGTPIAACGMDEVLTRGAAAIGWQTKWKGWGGGPMAVDGPKRRGIGMNTCNFGGGGTSTSSVLININRDGKVTYHCNINDTGNNSLTSQNQICAEALGMRIEDITPCWGDTDLSPEGTSASGSQITGSVGRATMMAAAEAKGQLLAAAADLLEVPIGTLEVKASKIYVAGVESDTTIANVVNHTRGSRRHMQATGYNQIDIAPGQTIRTFHANFVEVEVDTETGELTVENVVSVSDIGRALNPMSCENQLEGGFIMGMTIAEDIIRDYETGVSLNSNYLTFKMPTFNDCGPIECILVEEYDPTCPYGAKGIGEPCTIPASGAIANAIYNAIGVRLGGPGMWPPTPDVILKALGKI